MRDSPDAVSSALEAVLDRLGETVRRVGRRHGLAGADVEEVVQEVRIRLWRAKVSGENIAAAPASYVYRTAASAALDLIRRRRAKREDTIDAGRISDELMLADPHSAPDDAMQQEEFVAAVGRAVDELAENRRPVVRMYLAGYRLDEIADLLGWTEPKTRNHVYRGLADLRARLVELGFGPEATQ